MDNSLENTTIPITKAEQVKEIFTKFSKLITKHERSRKFVFEGMLPDSFIVSDTFHPLWEARKKAALNIFNK